MSVRVVILSDLHLGEPGCPIAEPAQLRLIWRGASHLVFNGDTGETSHDQLGPEARRVVRELVEIAQADGVRVTVLGGNHDPHISPRRRLWLAEGAMLVTHGDAFHPAMAPWAANAHLLRQDIAQAREQLAPHVPCPMELALRSAEWASARAWTGPKHERPHTIRRRFDRVVRVPGVLQYWRVAPKLAVAFSRLAGQQPACVVFGHSHRQGVWGVDGATVLNTGSYRFPGRPRAVIVEGDRVRTWAILPGANAGSRGFRLARRPVHDMILPAPALEAELPDQQVNPALVDGPPTAEACLLHEPAAPSASLAADEAASLGARSLRATG